MDRPGARLMALVLVVLQQPAAARGPDPRERLAAELRGLYAPPKVPRNAGGAAPTVRLPDGREVTRVAGLPRRPGLRRGRPRLVASRDRGRRAARRVAPRHRAGDASRRGRAGARAGARQPGRARGVRGRAGARGVGGAASLRRAGQAAARTASSADVRTAASCAAAEVAGGPAPGSRSRAQARAPAAAALAPGFRRGVSWWMSEGGPDRGRGLLPAPRVPRRDVGVDPHLGPAAARARRARVRGPGPPLRLPRPAARS